MALLVFDNQEYCISLNIFLSLVLSFKRSIFVHPNGYKYPRFWRRDNGGVGLCFDSLRSWKAAYSRDLSEFYRLSISLNGYGLIFFPLGTRLSHKLTQLVQYKHGALVIFI
jgi:hypothetical protein